eukprot:3191420-Pleurochrysis_carterae.AAC.1
MEQRSAARAQLQSTRIVEVAIRLAQAAATTSATAGIFAQQASQVALQQSAGGVQLPGGNPNTSATLQQVQAGANHLLALTRSMTTSLAASWHDHQALVSQQEPIMRRVGTRFNH